MSDRDYTQLKQRYEYLVQEREMLYDMALFEECPEYLLDPIEAEINYVMGLIDHYERTHS
jgi:hypothetical protein